MRVLKLTSLPLLMALLASLFAVTPAGAQQSSSSNFTIVPITSIGTTNLSRLSGGAGGTDGTAEPGVPNSLLGEIRQGRGERGRGSTTTPPNPPTEPPAVESKPVASSSVSGFNGLSHADQRLAGTGRYVNTQFSSEPPDQALCVSDRFLLESVNTALRVRSKTGADLTSAIPINQFFNLAPAIIRSDPLVFGDFTADPKCYYDFSTQRWFLTVLQADTDPATGNFTGPTSVLLAVSKSNDPTGDWNLFTLDTTNDGRNGSPGNPECPCLGDQPLIGADRHGFYISTNEFPLFEDGFNGANIYAIAKDALIENRVKSVVLFNNLPLAGDKAYSIQPATVPTDRYEPARNGTQFFMSALDFNSTLDNRIAVWSMINTRSLDSERPRVRLLNTVISSQTYGFPPPVDQKPGPTPLLDLVNAGEFGPPPPGGEKLARIESNDDRMNQVVFADKKLWSAVNTIVRIPSDTRPRAGIAYFIVSPELRGSRLVASIICQGYVAVKGNNVIFPAIGVNTHGKGAMVFSLAGPDYFPSAAYTSIDAQVGAGPVKIIAAGTGPQDGFTGYPTLSGQETTVARWGDYSAAVADANGDVWMATEFIPNTPRTLLANWGTFIAKVRP